MGSIGVVPSERGLVMHTIRAAVASSIAEKKQASVRIAAALAIVDGVCRELLDGSCCERFMQRLVGHQVVRC